MIVVSVMGGLGNQMQQYALYRKLKDLGKDAKLDTSWFLDEKAQEKVLAPRSLGLSRFVGLPMDVATKKERDALAGTGSFLDKVKKKLGKSRVFTESKMYHGEIFSMDNVYLSGYFACNKYYWDIMGELRKDFVFPESADPAVRKKNEEVRQRMQDPDVFSVSVHLRRGDYLDSANAAILGGICTRQYYDAACRYAEDRAEEEGKTPLFFVFSDDMDYARSCTFGTKGEEVLFCDFNQGDDNMLDMQLQSFCRANITANSTFSFWGSRLNPRDNALRIRPFRHRNNQVPEPSVLHDLWPGYVLIDRDGSIR
ncbi:MAG: alpha-1,2-fucosyltransferase [Lachnospiraceae bacterium]|jgi:hypothetical protein